MTATGELEIETFHFTWKIHDFSKRCKKNGDQLHSSVFKIGDAATESHWVLLFYPYGDTETAKDHVSCYTQLLFANSSWLKTYSFKLSLIDDDGNAKFMFNSTIQQFQTSKNVWGWSKFYNRESLMNKKDTLLTNDTLKVFCSITFNPLKSSITFSTEEVERYKIMLEDYETLYSTRAFSDLTIVIGTKAIQAHKSILSVRSKVFYAMLQHDMIERNNSTIAIDDISYEVMIELLRFLYCGKVQNIRKFAIPLLIAADKYDVDSLKMICERTLIINLKVEDVCETLIVANRLNCKKLKSITIDFIIKNIKAVTPTSEFRKLKISNAELLEEILFIIAKDSK